MPDLDALVSAASLAAARGDEDGVMLTLLDAWAEHRVTPLLEVATWLSGRFLRRHPPLETAEDWHALAQRRDPLSVTALLAAPVAERPTTLRKKLAALLTFPPDPRLALHGQQMLAQLRYERRSGRDKAYAAAEALLRRHGPLQGVPQDERLLDLCAAARALGPTTEDKLLAAVYANPQDDAPRLVYADWLMEQGDPLGTRIVRAVAGALEHELQQLYPMHHTRWLRHHMGPLPPDMVEFRRGFPVRVTLTYGPMPRFGPGWATVEEIDLLEPQTEVLRALSSLRRLPALRLLGLRYTGAGATWLTQLMPTLADLGLPELCLWNPALAAAVGSARWPSLRCLWLTVWHEAVPLDETSLGGFVAEPIEIGLWSPHHGVGHLVARALEAARSAAPAIRRIRFQRPSRAEPSIDPRVEVTLERDSEGALRQLRLVGFEPANVDQLWRVVGTAPAGSLREIVVVSRALGDEAFRRQVVRGLKPMKGAALTLRESSSP